MRPQLRLGIIFVWVAANLIPSPAQSQTGWLLLLPPYDPALVEELQRDIKIPALKDKAMGRAHSGWAVKSDAPFSAWNQWRAFDSAKECEIHREAEQSVALKSMAERETSKSPSPDAGWVALINSLHFARMNRSRCLPSSVIPLYREW
jgi:hypothetical protein